MASIYDFYDVTGNVFVINSDEYDTIVFRSLLDDELSLDSSRPDLIFDDIRNDNIYDYFYKLNSFIDSRQDNFETLPLDKIERTGSSYSVMMTNNNEVQWQKLAKPITGTIRLSDTVDQSIILFEDTLSISSFSLIENLTIDNHKFLGTFDKARAYTPTYYQDYGETNWNSAEIKINGKFEDITDTIPEKSDYTNGQLTFISKNSTIDEMLDLTVIDTSGNDVKVTGVNSKLEIAKINNVRNTICATRYDISAIDSDGNILIWGSYSSSYYQPPMNASAFTSINAGYYGFTGVTDENKVYVWGKNNLFVKYLINTMPTGNDFIDSDMGLNFCVALKEDGSLQHWGYTTYLAQYMIPEKIYTKHICAYKILFALDSDGYLEAYGKYDFYKLKAKLPTERIIDFDVRYATGVYLRDDGTVGQWGNTSGYRIPDFDDKTIVKVFAGKVTLHALADDGTLFTWGDWYTYKNTPENIEWGDVCGHNYVSAGIDKSGNIYTWGRDDLSTYDSYMVNRKPDVSAIISGKVISGYEYDVTLEEPISEGDIYLVSSNLYYTTTEDSVNIDDYILLPKKRVTIDGTDFIVTYDTLDINTSTIGLLYEFNNRLERVHKIQVDLTKSALGEDV